MAERKSGPVKPPVIDLKAREATSTTPPEEAAATEPADGPHPTALTRGHPPHEGEGAPVEGAEQGAPTAGTEQRAATESPAPALAPVARAKSGRFTKAAPSPAEPAHAPADDVGAVITPDEAAAEGVPLEAAPVVEATTETATLPHPTALTRGHPPHEGEGAPAEAPGPAVSPEAPTAESVRPVEEPVAAPVEPPPTAQPQPTAPPLPPRPPARLAMPWSAISLAALAGAVLGAILTYVVANWIALPIDVPEVADPAPALTALDDRAAALEARLATLEESGQDTRQSVDATLVQLDTAVAQLQQSIADVRAAIPEAQAPVDLSAIEAELQTLENRIEAVAAGASGADASALAENLSRIAQNVTALTARLDEVEGRLTTADQTFASVQSDIETLEAAIAAQNLNVGGTEIGPAVQLPLILTGLESAFARGRPYESELASLLTLLPDLRVPEAVTANATTGLIRPDALARRFDEAVPNILAGRTGESTGDWTRDAIEWAKAILALRPAEEIEGDTPEAIVSRLEAAVERYDFTGAAVLLAQLPEPMRLAAGEIGEAIAAHADAEQFVASLRAQALAPSAEGSN